MISYVMLVFVLLFILLFFYFVPLGLWIQAVVSLGVGRITIIDLIRMRLRKIAPRLVVAVSYTHLTLPTILIV